MLSTASDEAAVFLREIAVREVLARGVAKPQNGNRTDRRGLPEKARGSGDGGRVAGNEEEEPAEARDTARPR
jgi:hypothetical protein